MRFGELVDVSNTVANASGRLDKIGRLAEFLARTPEAEIEIAVAFLSGSPLQGRIGAAGSAIAAAHSTPPAMTTTLELGEIDADFSRIAASSGRGSAAAKAQLLRDLFARATAAEQDFLTRLLFGELRQGALEGVLVEAVARASRVPADRIRRAAMLTGTLPPVARAALVEGDAAVARFSLALFQPVQPMLAESADDVGEALEALGEASLEFKLDGARIQVHKQDDEVRVFTRNLRDVTVAVPEVVEIVRAMPARTVILDGEAIALRPDATPHPFQITMRRFGRKLDVERARAALPLTPMFFDCLYLDGQGLVDQPHARRVAALLDIVREPFVVPRIVTATPDEASAFLDRSMATGHEGVMVKAVDGLYAAGRRGQAWIKVKRARTLDLVVLAAEWGHGRRTGLLSNLHLGARDDRRGGFVMLGKTFKGLTDEMLTWQTKALLDVELARDGHTVHVRPELVVEVAFNDVQKSPVYPGGLALRFARVKGYRPDKTASDADTIGTVMRLYEEASGPGPEDRRLEE